MHARVNTIVLTLVQNFGEIYNFYNNKHNKSKKQQKTTKVFICLCLYIRVVIRLQKEKNVFYVIVSLGQLSSDNRYVRHKIFNVSSCSLFTRLPLYEKLNS